MHFRFKQKAFAITASIFMILLMPATAAFAGGALTLSKQANFSTSDYNFTRQDVLHIRVVEASLDFNDIKDNEFRLKPDSGGDDVEGSFTNHLNGTFTAKVQLSMLSGSETQWEVRVKIKDDGGNEFEERVSIVIAADDDDDDDDNDNDEVEIRGRIKSIAADRLVIASFTFFVDAKTVVLDHRNRLIRFADLRVDQLVEVRADRRADGSLLATRIKVEDDGNDELEFTGKIEAIDAASLVVLGVKFSVNQNTVVLDNRNNPLKFADLQVGLLVEIRADRRSDGSWLATRIKIEDQPNDEVELTGLIEAIDSNSLTVLKMKFTVNAATVVLDNRNNPIKFADLKIGQRVEVRADRQANGTLLATRVKLEDLQDDEVELTGAIEALTRNTLVVLEKTFTVGPNTVVLDNNNLPIKFTDLRIGEIVEVRADRQADGTLLATRLKREDLPNDEVELTGRISALDNNSLVVLGLKFAVNASTVVLDNNNNTIRFADLKVGLVVEIRANRRADGSLLATRIKIEDRLGIQGAVASVGSSSLDVAGIQVTLNGNTLILDQANRLLTSANLRSGEMVEIQAAPVTANALVALTVKKTGTRTGVVSDQATVSLPENFALQQNYPNPFNPATTIRFLVPANVGAQTAVTLRIYNVMGQLVRTLANGSFAAGSYIAVWNGENETGVKAGSGLYFYELKAGNFKAMKRMVLAQ